MRSVLLLIVFLFVISSIAHSVNGTDDTLHKRQSVAATMWSDAGCTGASITLSDIFPGYSNLGAIQWSNIMSSLKILDMNYVLMISTGNSNTGTTWAFRSPINVTSLSPYGLNDAINSCQIVYMGFGVPGAILYKDANYGSKSIYVTASNPFITNAAYSGYGSFDNDALSSIIIFPGTKVELYKDVNYGGGTPVTYTAQTTFTYIPQVTPNDWASSIKIFPF